ncbi:hypothetical protein Oweho_3215 [Owenweeksia hongkongensis DSM 17368]|uniref:Uncharacterized protein n=1 Tax=Owenweeksia hongkongensis (strain DSM 17368 / CIP 108786 / JCM 12287 / NRRL B-23963 / UST20020801) TaxID=926562 RepID=G8R3S9_OWEHD|nr:hypothetical protein [Owenweeksia hongkongensis]AEV34166.1 hypothetical protein Oweho_3215 [Owenweeksia hongkongensis DSM 17368]
MYLVNTLLGFLIAQIYDILKRNKDSEASPEKFNLVFFLQDTWKKILMSLALSIAISIAIHLNWDNAVSLFSGEVTLNDLIYLVVGAVPELVLQWAKRKGGFLQSSTVQDYDRKSGK